MSSLPDANIFIRHFTGEPAEQARRATAYLRSAGDLLLLDLVTAECVYVLQSVYAQSRAEITVLLRSVLAIPSVRSEHPGLLHRTLDLYESQSQISFVDAYLIAAAEVYKIADVVSFYRGIKGSSAVRRVEPQG